MDARSRSDERFRELLSKPMIAIGELQQCSFGGVPDHLRAVIWKLLLGYLPLEKAKRQDSLAESRAQYAIFLDAIADRVATDRNVDPHVADEELRTEIDKDIERTNPDLDWFTRPEHTAPMRRILFVYAKLNSGVRYVQGMNELLAPLWFVMATERTEVFDLELSTLTSPPMPAREHSFHIVSPAEAGATPSTPKRGDSTASISSTEGSLQSPTSAHQRWRDVPLSDAEADTFFVFMAMMSEVRDVFIVAHDSSETGIRGMLSKYGRMLVRREPLLAAHLKSLGLDHTFYAMRWCMTLLSREFSFPEVVMLWDSLLADPARFAFLLQTCVAMVRLQKGPLLRADFGTAMKLLQRYPSIDFLHLLATSMEIRAEENAEACASLSHSNSHAFGSHWQSSTNVNSILANAAGSAATTTSAAVGAAAAAASTIASNVGRFFSRGPRSPVLADSTTSTRGIGTHAEISVRPNVSATYS